MGTCDSRPPPPAVRIVPYKNRPVGDPYARYGQPQVPGLLRLPPYPSGLPPAPPQLGLPQAPPPVQRVDTRPMPPGWEVALDPNGRPYYIDRNRRMTTYDDPRGPLQGLPPIPPPAVIYPPPTLGPGVGAVGTAKAAKSNSFFGQPPAVVAERKQNVVTEHRSTSYFLTAPMVKPDTRPFMSRSATYRPSWQRRTTYNDSAYMYGWGYGYGYGYGSSYYFSYHDHHDSHHDLDDYRGDENDAVDGDSTSIDYDNETELYVEENNSGDANDANATDAEGANETADEGANETADGGGEADEGANETADDGGGGDGGGGEADDGGDDEGGDGDDDGDGDGGGGDDAIDMYGGADPDNSPSDPRGRWKSAVAVFYAAVSAAEKSTYGAMSGMHVVPLLCFMALVTAFAAPQLRVSFVVVAAVAVSVVAIVAMLWRGVSCHRATDAVRLTRRRVRSTLQKRHSWTSSVKSWLSRCRSQSHLSPSFTEQRRRILRWMTASLEYPVPRRYSTVLVETPCRGGNVITIVTQLSMDRIPQLREMSESWSGAIVAAVHVPRGMTVKEAARAFAPHVAVILAESRASVTIVLVAEESLKWWGRDYYPVNALRNAALEHATTPLVFLLDVDFVPSLGLHDRLVASYDDLLAACNDDCALVIPALEVLPPAQAMMSAATPVRDVMNLVKRRTVVSFHEGHFEAGHAPTDLQRWARGDSADGAIGGLPMYRVAFAEYYEPYVIVARTRAPRYDERFRGYGLNKIAHLLEIAASGAVFHVAACEFVFARQHAKSPSWRATFGTHRDELQSLRIQALYNRFKTEIARKYGAASCRGSGDVLIVADDRDLTAVAVCA